MANNYSTHAIKYKRLTYVHIFDLIKFSKTSGYM